jgi:iron complex transport system permease protein
MCKKIIVNTPKITTQKHLLRLILASLLLVFLLLVSMTVGNKPIPISVIWQSVWQFDATNSDHLLVNQLRIPRSLVAVLSGFSLGAAGVVMQALTRNPLADPGILGINAGATLAVVISIAVFGFYHISIHMIFGMIGAMFAGLIVVFLANFSGKSDPIKVILSGVALSAVLLAFSQIIIVNSDELVFDQFRHWIVGSMQGRGYEVLGLLSVSTVIGLIATMAISRVLDTLSLGKELSESLGLNIPIIWLSSLFIVTLLAGTATAAVGPIAFIGLSAPHLARFFTGPNHLLLLPYAILIAGLLMLVADILGRWIAHPAEISAGIMVALIGGPFFVVLARRKKIFEL